MRHRWALCGLLVGVFCSPPLQAQQQPGPLVHLQLQNCSSLSAPVVRRILAAELGTGLADAPGPGVTTATVVCHNSDAELEVTDPLSRKAVNRHIDVGDAAPKARARLVAIAISELVLASWSELETNPYPQVEPAGPPPPPAARSAARHWVSEHADHSAPAEEREAQQAGATPRKKHVPRPFRLLAVVSQRSFFSYPGALWGGGVRVSHEPLSHVSWSLDAVIDRGQIDSAIGRYNVETATLGASVYLYQHWSWFAAGIGGGLRVGAAHSVGKPGAQTAGASGFAPWGWPLATLSLSAQFKPVVFGVEGETSYVILPLSGDKSSIANPSISGMWYGVELGIGLTL